MLIDMSSGKKTGLIKGEASQCFDFQGLPETCLEAFSELHDVYVHNTHAIEITEIWLK